MPIETPISGGSRESETSEETVTPIRSPSTSTLRIETPCGQSRIRPRRSSPVVIAENATERERESGGGEIRTHGAREAQRSVRLRLGRVSDLGRTLLEVRVGDEDAKRRGRARAEIR